MKTGKAFRSPLKGPFVTGNEIIVVCESKDEQELHPTFHPLSFVSGSVDSAPDSEIPALKSIKYPQQPISTVYS